jgi:hypothetical protein
MLAYGARLLCLSMATFLVAHLLLGAVAGAVAPAVVRIAQRRRSTAAARLLFAFRMMPFAGPLFLVAGICVPSFLWLEPAGAAEEVSAGLRMVAVLCAAMAIAPAVRSVRALVQSARFVRDGRRRGQRINVREFGTAWVVPDVRGVMLAGIVRPTVFLGPKVLSLSEEELAAALRHERAHARGLDNSKRLLFLLAPGPLFGSAALERAWSQFTEWAADDYATRGNAVESAVLASALVRVARLGTPPRPCALVTSLVESTVDLKARVDRLLEPPGYTEERHSRVPVAFAIAATAVFALYPATLRSAHSLLELLMR